MDWCQSVPQDLGTPVIVDPFYRLWQHLITLSKFPLKYFLTPYPCCYSGTFTNTHPQIKQPHSTPAFPGTQHIFHPFFSFSLSAQILHSKWEFDIRLLIAFSFPRSFYSFALILCLLVVSIVQHKKLRNCTGKSQTWRVGKGEKLLCVCK